MPVKIYKHCFVLLILISSLNSFGQTSEYLKFSSFLNKVKFSASDTIKLALKISIKEHYHINSYEVNDPTLIKTSVTISSGKFRIINTFFPPDKKLKFEFTEKEINVYEGDFVTGLTIIPVSNIPDGIYEFPVSINFQACDEHACYPPKTVSDTILIDINKNSPANSANNNDVFGAINFTLPSKISKDSDETGTSLKENSRTESPGSDEDQISNLIEEQGVFAAVLFIFLGGLALNLTPCVYPLIPITVSFFGAQSSGSKSQSILMGIFYALGMSVTYSALGVFAALTGSLLGNALQNPLVIIIIALIMLALGTSMFGLFEIRVPQGLALMGNKNRSGYFGSLLMGLTVGFIAAPCIGPFVLSLLVYVGKLGNPLTGFLLFFILSMGLGLPYIFLSASSSSISKLPRSGEWMEGIKIIFGLILFGMALNTLEPLIPKNVFKVIFPLYVLLSGAYLILLDRKGSSSIVYSKIKYLLAVFAIVLGTWMLKPAEINDTVNWKILTSVESIDQSVSSENKPVMIDFYADWCAQCKELDEYTYTNPEIVELSKSINTIKVDLTKENDGITNKYKIKGLPVVVFLNSEGQEYEDLRVTGFLKPEEFKKKLNLLNNYITQK
ncbi:MAG: thioredoxin domain-containing protein [Bacteroidota bacterium]|nr:thioredoxin domain-containing protein [Bacteroidota bacterium]